MNIHKRFLFFVLFLETLCAARQTFACKIRQNPPPDSIKSTWAGDFVVRGDEQGRVFVYKGRYRLLEELAEKDRIEQKYLSEKILGHTQKKKVVYPSAQKTFWLGHLPIRHVAISEDSGREKWIAALDESNTLFIWRLSDNPSRFHPVFVKGIYEEEESFYKMFTIEMVFGLGANKRLLISDASFQGIDKRPIAHARVLDFSQVPPSWIPVSQESLPKGFGFFKKWRDSATFLFCEEERACDENLNKNRFFECSLQEKEDHKRAFTCKQLAGTCE